MYYVYNIFFGQMYVVRYIIFWDEEEKNIL